MRAFVINPYAHTVEQREIPSGYEGLVSVLKEDPQYSGTLQAIAVGEQSLYLDDNGMLEAGRPVFTFRGGLHHIAGIAVLLGPPDEEGNDQDCVLDLEVVENAVEWTNLESTGDFSEGREYEGEVYGKPWTIIEGGKPILMEQGGADEPVESDTAQRVAERGCFDG